MRYTFLLTLMLAAFCRQGFAQQGEQQLWYNEPAVTWEEALPLGNGKTGAMVFGRVNRERIQLNDNTLWSGYPDAGNNPNGPTVLPQVRAAIFQGDYEKATQLWRKMQGPYSATYLPLGDIFLQFHQKDSVCTNYKRLLSLDQAISKTSYTLKGINYEREVLTSYPDKALLVRIKASKAGALNLNIGLLSKLKFTVQVESGNTIVLSGKAPKYIANRKYEPQQVIYDEKEGMIFQIRLKVKNEGGTVSMDNNQLKVLNAKALSIYLTEATSFNGFNKSPVTEGKDPAIETRKNMDHVFAKSFEKIKLDHIADHQELFNRVKFQLIQNPLAEQKPTNLRLLNYTKEKNDQGLQVLYYQFGRYLMIASSRPGSRPSNLQGIWNDLVQPPWHSNYTTNINTEMNYWPAENTNLSECHQPLFDFIKELAVNGAITAKVNYNIDKGWVAHHNSDLWAKTSPPGAYDKDHMSNPRWSAWPMSASWFSTHLFEHYLYTGDQAFLKNIAYPLMKGAAEFMLHWLIKDDQTNYLVTVPSTSPENTMKIDGKEYQLSKASTMDMSILRALFSDLISASEILDIDKDFRKELMEARSRLYPFHIGQYGQLQEWFKDYDDPKDTHRHISHLFSLFPGNQISVFNTPELASAAKQSLIFRGDVSTGWSMAWKINWWARLQDGNHAYKILEDAFTFINSKEENIKAGGTYPNLFDAHPPFQIDGNFGATAGMTEMLLQSQDGMVSLLPALPAAWKTGRIAGIKARGNFEIGIGWDNGKLTEASVKSLIGGNCKLRTLQKVRVVDLSGKTVENLAVNPLLKKPFVPAYENNSKTSLKEINHETGFVIDFKTEKGKIYRIVPEI